MCGLFVFFLLIIATLSLLGSAAPFLMPLIGAIVMVSVLRAILEGPAPARYRRRARPGEAWGQRRHERLGPRAVRPLHLDPTAVPLSGSAPRPSVPRRDLQALIAEMPAPYSYLIPAGLGVASLALIHTLMHSAADPMMALLVTAMSVLAMKLSTGLAAQWSGGERSFWQQYDRWLKQRESRSGMFFPWTALGLVGAVGATLLVLNATNGLGVLLILLLTAVSCGQTARLAGLIGRHERNRQIIEKELENALLHVAQKRNGTITATDVAMETDLTMSQAAQVLDGMHTRGLIGMDIRDDGVVVYTFPELVPAEEERPSGDRETGRLGNGEAGKRGGQKKEETEFRPRMREAAGEAEDLASLRRTDRE